MGTTSKKRISKYSKHVVKLDKPLYCKKCNNIRTKRIADVCPKCFQKLINKQPKSKSDVKVL